MITVRVVERGALTSSPRCIKHVLVTKSKVFSKSRVYAEVSKDFFGASGGSSLHEVLPRHILPYSYVPHW
jgi:hypothetical protein